MKKILTLLILISPLSAQAALTDGLVGYWTLDGKDVSWATGTVTDKSGQGNSGKVVSMSTTTSPILGKIGQALNFDGADDYVNVSNSIAGVQTVSYWIKGATSTNGGIELNSNAWIDDLAIPQGFTSPSVYIDGVLQGSLVGSELLPNNNFASNITSWTEMNVCGTAATSWVNGVSGDGSTGYLRFTTQNNVCADRFRVAGSITSGAKSYRVSFWYRTTTIAVDPTFYTGDDFATLANSKTFSLPVTSSAWRYTSRVLSTTGASYPIVGVYHYTPSGDAAGTIDLDGVSLKEITTRYPITDTKWHHVVITTGTGITADAIKLGRGNLFINGPGSYLSGTMDDVRIYNRALSAQEIRQLYNLGSARVATSPVDALKNGLVGYWTFDGKDVNWLTNTFADASGNGNTGTTTNTFSTTTSPVAGKIGQALDFRSTSVIGIPNSSSLQVGNVFTLSAWVKMDSLTARQSIFSTRSNADAGGWNIEVGPAGIDGVGDKRVPNSVAVATPGLFNAVSDNVLATSTWAHITYVRNGDSVGTQKIYVNGISRTLSTDNPQAITNNTAIKLVGATTYPGNFDGIIDDVRLYNRALSAQEVRQLYALGGKKVASSPTQSLSPGLVGYWTMDGSKVNWTTGTVTDSSGQGNNGKVVTMSTTTSTAVGKIGQALKFDGTNDSVSLGSNRFGSPSSFTISAWVKTATSTGHQSIFSEYHTGVCGDALFYIFASTGITSYNDGASGNNHGNTSVTDNKWHHVIYTYDTMTGKHYVDGVAQTSSTAAAWRATCTLDVRIGADAINTRVFDGAIDDVRFYNRALSAQEVRQIYSVGRVTSN